VTVGVPGKVVVVATDSDTTGSFSLNSFVMVGLFVEQFPALSHARTSIVW